MPQNKQQKGEVLQKIQEKIAKSKAILFSADQGLNVKTVEDLRKQLKAEGAEYLVAKKTLVKMATKELMPSEELDKIDGSVGIILSYEDEISGAKILHKFAKANEKLNISGGILENKYIDTAVVQRLASLPTKQELLAKLVGTIQAPVSGFVNVLSGNLRNLVGVLGAIKDKKAN